MKNFHKIHFTEDHRSESQAFLMELVQKYGNSSLENADVIVVLGGDGQMLHTLQKTLKRNIPAFGINFGSVGFLMNARRPQDLMERLQNSVPTTIHPLEMKGVTTDGTLFVASAINEISILRQTHQAAKIRIIIDGVTRLEEMTADGILVASPAGSTAYNLSVYGPVLPIGSNLLALTPISAFRPRRWRGAILSNKSHIRFEIINPQARPVSATADSTEIRNIATLDIHENLDNALTLLFDADHALNERFLQEQFLQLP